MSHRHLAFVYRYNTLFTSVRVEGVRRRKAKQIQYMIGLLVEFESFVFTCMYNGKDCKAMLLLKTAF